MHITLLCTGKTEETYLQEGIALYRKRISHYLPFEIIELPSPKKWSALPPALVKAREGEQILKQMRNSDYCVLLDEKGKLFDSRSFSDFIQLQMNRSVKNLFFVVGGAWGFPEEVRAAAHLKISLSPMTFPHQLVRLIFSEQLYRAMTIIRNESYHND